MSETVKKAQRKSDHHASLEKKGNKLKPKEKKKQRSRKGRRAERSSDAVGGNKSKKSATSKTRSEKGTTMSGKGTILYVTGTGLHQAKRTMAEVCLERPGNGWAKDQRCGGKESLLQKMQQKGGIGTSEVFRGEKRDQTVGCQGKKGTTHSELRHVKKTLLRVWGGARGGAQGHKPAKAKTPLQLTTSGQRLRGVTQKKKNEEG